MTGLTKKEIEEILDDAQGLLQNWMKFKMYLMKSFSQEPISSDEEGNFLETKSVIAKFQRMVGEKVKDSFYYGADKIQVLTRQCISVGHLRQLPMVDRKNLVVEWHNVYVIITKLAGALNFMKDGYVFKPKAKKGTSIASMKSAAGGKETKKSKSGGSEGGAAGTVIKVIIGLAIFGAAIAFLLKRMNII